MGKYWLFRKLFIWRLIDVDERGINVFSERSLYISISYQWPKSSGFGSIGGGISIVGSSVLIYYGVLGSHGKSQKDHTHISDTDNPHRGLYFFFS